MVARSGFDGQEDSWYAAPDPAGSAPGRGAHLHPDGECLARAERSRAFVRALRHDAGTRGPLHLDELHRYLHHHPHHDLGDHPAAEAAPRPDENGSISS